MAQIEPINFLDNVIGRLGKVSKVELPPELQGNWAPQGKSLEEINKARDEIRKLNIEFNQKSAAATLTFTGSSATTLVSVPANKKFFVTNITLSVFNLQNSGNGVLGLEIYNRSGTAYRSLARISIIALLTTSMTPQESMTCDFSVPIAIDELETIRIVSNADLFGVGSATIQGWQEDKII